MFKQAKCYYAVSIVYIINYTVNKSRNIWDYNICALSVAFAFKDLTDHC